MENEVKEPVLKYNWISPEEYLEIERTSEQKHEYYNGEIFAMAGASVAHNLIFHNIYSKLAERLQGKNCKPFSGDLRIHIPESSLYTYPDISIICGKPETTDEAKDTCTNPSVIFEIQSKSTFDYDRGRKSLFYRRIKTLKEYVLVDSMSCHVEIMRREEDNSWNVTAVSHPCDMAYIRTVGISLLLRDIYQDINFDE